MLCLQITPGQWYFTAGLSVDSVLKQTQYLKQVVASPQLLGSEFKTYTQYFNKKYSSKAFETQAMTNFAANLKIIAEHNANPDNKFLVSRRGVGTHLDAVHVVHTGPPPLQSRALMRNYAYILACLDNTSTLTLHGMMHAVQPQPSGTTVAGAGKAA